MPNFQKLAPVDNQGASPHSSNDVRLHRLDMNLPYTGTPFEKTIVRD
jgi:hypothetical protein